MKHLRGCPLFTHPTQRKADHPTDCRCQPGKRLSLNGQPMRMLRYLRDFPGSSSLEITRDLFIVNVTGRVSDLRAAGYLIECRKGPDRRDRYRVVERKPVLTGEQVGMAL